VKRGKDTITTTEDEVSSQIETYLSNAKTRIKRMLAKQARNAQATGI
jgi:hypothetical protein